MSFTDPLEPMAGTDDRLLIGWHNGEIPPNDVDLHFPFPHVIAIGYGDISKMGGKLAAKKLRRVYYTDSAIRSATAEFWNELHDLITARGGELIHAKHFDTKGTRNA